MKIWPMAAMVRLAAARAASGGQGTIKPGTHYSDRFNRCMAAAGGSTYPMRDCQNDELARWDGWLNQVYRAVMAKRLPAEKARLRDSERAWLHSHPAKMRSCRRR